MVAKARPGLEYPGVGAGLVIRRDDGRLLLYRRVNPPEAGFWNIVGGKVDFMEASQDAARREAEEETGLSIGHLDFLCLSEQCLEQDRQHWRSVIYLTQDFSGEPQITEPDKLSDMGWFSLQDLPQPMSAFAKDAISHLK